MHVFIVTRPSTFSLSSKSQHKKFLTASNYLRQTTHSHYALALIQAPPSFLLSSQTPPLLCSPSPKAFSSPQKFSTTKNQKTTRRNVPRSLQPPLFLLPTRHHHPLLQHLHRCWWSHRIEPCRRLDAVSLRRLQLESAAQEGGSDSVQGVWAQGPV